MQDAVICRRMPNFDVFLRLRKQSTFRDATTGFPAKGRLRNERRNSILSWRVTTRVWILLLIGRAACKILLKRIRNTTQLWVVTRNQYGIYPIIYQRSFRGESNFFLSSVLYIARYFWWQTCILFELSTKSSSRGNWTKTLSFQKRRRLARNCTASKLGPIQISF